MAMKDKMGRPVVVVTGLGVVTSLGAGKTDNWAKLTAGVSGIHGITRFATEGLKTRIAGTIDFLGSQPSSVDLSERFADLAAVVEHYSTTFNLNLSVRQKQDLIEYLKSL